MYDIGKSTQDRVPGILEGVHRIFGGCTGYFWGKIFGGYTGYRWGGCCGGDCQFIMDSHTHTQPSQRGEDSEVPLNVVAPSWLKWIEMAGGLTRWELGRVGSWRAGKPRRAGWLSGMVGRVGVGQDQVEGLEV